jgi:hypothetical protein
MRETVLILFTVLHTTCAWFCSPVSAQKQHIIPIAGNTFLTQTKAGAPDRMGREGIQNWQSPGSVYSLWFHTSGACELDIDLKLDKMAGESQIMLTDGSKSFSINCTEGINDTFHVGRIKVKAAGYVRIDMQGMHKTASAYPRPVSLIITALDTTLNVSYVKDNEDNRFYWGRRGPSVHLSYTSPPNKDLEWFYSEITVPDGQDVIGSYFMANGFAEGYFGMQVNSATERRVIFSVWSPFVTDNPEDIPETDRIKVVRKGEQTIAHDFGNEGSGGHSRIIFPWKAGITYRFLNSVRPDGKGNTIYSAWFFAPEVGQWQFITTFLRPKTDTWLKRPHSFLESFIDSNGYLGRMAFYGNQWARDTDGKWHPLTEARFTGDDIARRGYRLDFAGGTEGTQFFLRNGGFFHPNVPLNTMHHISPGGYNPPEADLEGLP